MLMISLFIFTFSCKNLFDGDDNGSKDPREYTWTVDTLAYPGEIQTLMRNIWGSSPEDIYVVGHCSTVKGTMWHYDGEEWKPVILASSIGGNIRGYHGIEDILGFGPDNVWAVGDQSIRYGDKDSSLVIHYDGAEWWEVETPEGLPLHAIGGSGPNDIWVGGRYGTLFHYNGDSWKSDSIPIAVAYDTTRFTYFRSFSGNNPDEIYATYWDVEGWGFLLSYNGDEWVKEDSFYVWDHSALWMSPSGKLYSTGESGVSRWNDGTWETVLEGEFNFFEISGTDDDNVFVVGYRWSDRRGAIFHSNGVDWYQYRELPDLPKLLGVWTNGEEVFVVGNTSSGFPEKTIILHGR